MNDLYFWIIIVSTAAMCYKLFSDPDLMEDGGGDWSDWGI